MHDSTFLLNMKICRYIFFITLSLLSISCGVNKQIKQLGEDANAAFQSKDYANALRTYEQIISMQSDGGKKIEGDIYQKAGLAAWELKETSKTIDYLEKAKQTPVGNDKTLYTLALAYLEVDNLSKEINHLEEYVERYPNGEDAEEVKGQLFLAYVKSLNWDQASAIWPQIDGKYQSQAKYLEGHMKVCESLKHFDQMNRAALQLLKMDRNNCSALETLAIYYYRMAEERYQTEMKAYEKNRTNRQYKQLLNALEEINANFRTSREYFERLYKLNPEPRFANYLGNIYTRFENKKQADYYYRKAKGN